MAPPERAGTALVIDDEPHILRAVRNALAGTFERVLEAETARAGIDAAAASRPDLIVLDLALPDAPGLAVCREVRKWSDAPILVLSAKHAEADKIELLDAGADDYVTKPFSPAELMARVRALQRRSRTEREETPFDVDGLTIDVARRTVSRAGEDIHLTPTEWALLRVFVKHAGRVLTHRQLFSAVWARSSGDPQQYLRVYVAQLRRKIEVDPVQPLLITTEPGVGYRFRALD